MEVFVMRETPRAVRAYEDWLGMGPNRNLKTLADRYRTSAAPVPSRHYSRLKAWSSAFGWASRAAGEMAREREAAEARLRSEREKAFRTGLAQDFERIRTLNKIAEREARVVLSTLDKLAADPEGERGRLLSRYQIVKAGLDGSLKALALETGGRAHRVSVQRDLESYAKQLAIERGYDINDAIALAKLIARGES
jgi:hypothetical protein